MFPSPGGRKGPRPARGPAAARRIAAGLLAARLTLLPVGLALLPGGLAGCSGRHAEINVYAAVSLTEVLRDLGARFEKATGSHVNFNFSGSNVLALQIEAGAPADVFFPADAASLDLLEQRGLLVPDTRRTVISNRLVVVTQRDSPAPVKRIEDLERPDLGRIAIAEPAGVPAGIYAREYLEGRGLWDRLRDRLVPLENVRAVLAAVASGDVAAGIVYKTDAAVSDRVSVAVEVPPGEGPAIVYPAAVLKDARSPDLARAFVTFLVSAEARVVFRKYAFEPAPPEQRSITEER